MKMRFYAVLTSLVVILFSGQGLFGQTTACLGDDAAICLGDQVTIDDCANFGAGSSGVPYSLSPIAYNPDPYTSPNTVSLSDDQFSQVINIGFDFCFYGNTYNQLVISSNNYISFDLANAGGYSPWGTTAIPNPGLNQIFNSIMGPWQDIHPGLGGVISYETYGVAPNRRFVVSWSNIPMFSCTGIFYTSQIKLFEGSNYLETHIVNKQVCSGWNNGNAVHGVHSPLGTDALTVPGRNNTQWSVIDEGYLWIPELSVQWESTQGNTYPYTGNTLTVTPIPTPPSDSVGYFISSVDNCGAGIGASDTTWITVSVPSVSASGTDDICSAGQGTVTATPISGIGPFSFDWPTLGSQNQTVSGVFAGTYTVNMTDALGCSASTQVTVGDTPAQFQGSTTLVSCPGGNNGTAYAEMVPVLGNVSYEWYDASNNLIAVTQTATGLAAGQYTCIIASTIGCQGTVVVDVSEIPGMIGNIVSITDVSCNSGSDGIMEVNITQGTAPYSYSWDNSMSNSNNADDLVAGTHTITIVDDSGCVITITGIVNEPNPLSINSLTPDTQICPEDDIMLSAAGTGGSSAYTFTWSENGNVIGTGATITVDPSVTNTEYCVELSEACGSPTDNACMLLYFPTPIQPSVLPDMNEKCLPGYFEFTHTSSNASEIATTYFDFGNDQFALENGDDSTSVTYHEVGVFDVIMTVTSVYGCVYVDTLDNLAEVKPNPTADFTFSTNPVSMFESEGIILQDRSTVDVVNWQWISPNSSPNQSTLTNPIMNFPQEPGTYPVTLIVESIYGCWDTVTYNLTVHSDILFFAPNSFTPDDDEYNQTWKPEITGIDIYDYELLIFNRWGEVIWENHDPSQGWDGTYEGQNVQTGTYTWKAVVSDPYDDSKKTFNGFINVLR